MRLLAGQKQIEGNQQNLRFQIMYKPHKLFQRDTQNYSVLIEI